jgi:hypothetical protein
MRMRQIAFFFSWFLFGISFVAAQSPNGTISGMVFDSSGAPIAGAEILIANDATDLQYSAKTNSEGIYVVPNLPPGMYRVQVSRIGFKTLIKPDVTLNVQDALALNFTLHVGAVSEIVTVTGGAPLVNTESGSVSTVIDRTFVESLPLNGRSFNTLLQLTPGVVIAQNASSLSSGQFSIAGQRTDANSFIVDGVSANFGVRAAVSPGDSGTGSAQAFSVLGGTSSLVSVEALQEFRVETSSFSAEYGRSPGGQVVLTTRSGTSELHGGLYEYFRNDALDANDWFANQASQPRAAERHNDFGGYSGGSIGKSKTFFFFSFEGARLRLPTTSVIQVPSLDARASLPSAQAEYLKAYPLPNGAVSPGDLTAQFTGTYSNRASLDAAAIRIDHNFGSKFALFGRYNYAPSQSADRLGSLNTIQTSSVNTQTLTVGLNIFESSERANAVRGNYSVQQAKSVYAMDSFGGAVPLQPSLLVGSLAPASNQGIFQTFDTAAAITGPNGNNRVRQVNLVDTFSAVLGSHRLEIGGDYRAIFLDVAPYQNQILLFAPSVANLVSSGAGSAFAVTLARSSFLAQSFSAFGNDTWKMNARLTMNFGLRWELNPAPSPRGSTSAAAWENVNDPAKLALAPQGTPLWGTSYGNFAPRFGVAYSLDSQRHLVLRAGAGIFYDLGLGTAGNLSGNFPNEASLFTPQTSLPPADVRLFLPVLSRQPPYPTVSAFDPNLALPRSYQWNVSLERAFGERQALTVTYVGQAGRDLLRQSAQFQPNSAFNSLFELTNNSAHSNYNALQVQFRRPLSTSLQVLLGYTLSHSLDNVSSDAVVGPSNVVVPAELDYASSDFDARHSFSGAATYLVPAASNSKFFSKVTKDWTIATIVVARSGFPFNALVFATSPVPGTTVRPDLVPGQPLWIANAAAGGGRSLNAKAFAIPTTARQGTEARNGIVGFGLTQIDSSIERNFRLAGRTGIKFRADAFNLLNHPNFTNPQGVLASGPSFLQSQEMANQGLGGLNPLFQEGGPRSLQLSLKLSF